MRLAELVGTLSLATDAGTAMPEESGLMAAIAAAKLGEVIGATPREQSDAYYLALLRYSGCTADNDIAFSLFGDELQFGRDTYGLDYGDARQVLPAVLRSARRGKGVVGGAMAMARALGKLPKMPAVSRAHCEVADLLAARLGMDATLRAALVQHSERWNGSGMPAKLKGDAIALTMRLVHVAFDVVIGFKLGGAEGAVSRVKQLSKKGLDPNIVEKFVALSDRVVSAIDVPSIWKAFLEAEPAPQKEVNGDAIDEALATMAAFADLKSKYTRGHSTAVSELAAAAGKAAGLDEAMQRDLRRAGLLHDIGRVAITSGIWDKAEPLTDLEREKIRLHTYIGERVLARAPALAAIAELSCLAHERLDGAGYHRRLSAAACPPAARILAAADVYVALGEDRPHRKAMTREDAAAEMTKMAEGGSLCPDAARAVLAAAGHVVKKVDRAHGLTDREIDVLRLIAKGFTNKEIASSLEISTKTAGHHVQHIFEKLGVTTRAAAAICAMSKGLTSA
ncbi:MAG TPA: HD domain-containing phosphohydrolase [Kofleriaceae bacterium]|nr:HD domain-containing phosphohydrolase [Kofleriaceae bacterium]